MSNLLKSGLVGIMLLCHVETVFADAWQEYDAALDRELAGDVEGAMVLYDLAIAAGELSGERLAEVLTARAAALRTMGRDDDALSDLHVALEVVPGRILTLLARAETLKRMGRLDEALADVELLLKQDPGNPSALVHRGLLLKRMGREEESLETAAVSAEQALQRQERAQRSQWEEYPQEPGSVAEEDQAFLQAMAPYDKLVRQYPYDALAWVERGVALAGQGRLDQALADFDKALSLDAYNAAALYNRGFVHYRKGRLALARQDWQRAKALDPSLETPDF